MPGVPVGGTVDDKVGEGAEKDAREAHLSLSITKIMGQQRHIRC